MVLNEPDLTFALLTPGLRRRRGFLCFVLRDESCGSLDGSMHRQEREVGEERLRSVRLDETDRLVRDPVRRFRVIGRVGHGEFGLWVEKLLAVFRVAAGGEIRAE